MMLKSKEKVSALTEGIKNSENKKALVDWSNLKEWERTECFYIQDVLGGIWHTWEERYVG